MERLRERLKEVPCQPGVYMYQNSEGQVIYVGKAKILRNRMRSYFQAQDRLLPKVRAMMNRVADFDYIVTASEVEALILENNLIKAYQPRYNILMRDDKTYPYLKVTLAEPFPRICITREKRDGVSRYFGPYTDASSLKETLKLLTHIFPLRTCKTMKSRPRPCLNRDIGRCLGPCTGTVDQAAYRLMVDGIISFLEGNAADIARRMESEMRTAAAALEFEKAARIRDQLKSLQQLNLRQKVVFEKPYHMDIMVVIVEDKPNLALVFKIRAGKLIAKDTYWLQQAMDERSEEIMEFFMKQYYADQSDVPPEVVVNILPGDIQVVEAWLSSAAGRRVKLYLPQRGEKKALLDMVLNNARWLWEERQKSDRVNLNTLQQLSTALELEVVPQRVEGYDISHLAGEETVASMVVFTAGQADKKHYRRFKMKVPQNNDYASLVEALERRFKEARQGNAAFLPEPDLIMIDGGAGQVNAVAELLQAQQIDIPVIGLAKREEIIYRPGGIPPLKLERRHAGLMLLQRVRDEAHRFAIEYNRKRRGKKLTISALDQIAGVGEARKNLLLKEFGSVAALQRASLEEITLMPGIGINVGKMIYNALHRENAHEAKEK